jgi:hypothetical protein
MINTVGLANAKEIFFTGRSYAAPKAQEMGMVHYILPQDQLSSFTYEMAREISENAPLSLKGMKVIFNKIFLSQKLNPKDAEEIEFNDGSKWATLQDWYGDTSQFFHLHVHLPIFNFCQSRIKFKSIEIDYDRAREMFYESDKKFWDEVVAYAAE